MNILLITRYFPPLEGIATNRMTSWAKYWAKKGHHVTVLTTEKPNIGDQTSDVAVEEVPYFDPISFFSGDRIKEGALKEKKSLSRFLMTTYRCRLNERIPGRTDFWIRPAKKKLQSNRRFDLIVSSYGPPAAHLIGRYAKKQYGCPWFADFRDLWVRNHNYKGVWPFTLLERWLERQVVHEADLVLTVSNGLKATLNEQYPEIDVRVVPNGFDREDYQTLERKKSGSKFSLVYTGTLFEKRYSIEPLFEALSNLLSEQPNIAKRLEVVFYGSATGYLAQQIRRFHIQSLVKYRGLIPVKECRQVQLGADAFLLFDFLHSTDGILSGKVFEYLFVDKPILALGVGQSSELGQLLTQSGLGLICENRAPAIQKKLAALVEGSLSHQSDRELIERYSREAHAELITSWALKCSHRAMSSKL